MSVTATPEPGLRERVRRQRTLVAVALLVLAVAVLLAWAGGGSRRGWLDPGSPEPDGSRALANLLRDQGVDVVEVRTADEAVARSGPGSTLLVTGTEYLFGAVAQRVAQARPQVLVLVEPTQSSLDLLVPGVEAVGVGEVAVRQPLCVDAVADRTGSAVIGGVTFVGGDGAVGCYPADGTPTLLLVPATGDRPATTLLGSGAPMTNDRLADEGDAALTMGLLGSQPTLVWYRTSPTDPLLSTDDLPTSAAELLPDWVVPVIAQLLIAALLAALWRGRRLGPVVSEPLPVVVRAAEATEGRARLYRRWHDRAHAATALRRAAAEAAASAAGVPPRAGPQALVATVAARTGRPAPYVAALLMGDAPADDAALARLAADLDTLVAEVRRT